MNIKQRNSEVAKYVKSEHFTRAASGEYCEHFAKAASGGNTVAALQRCEQKRIVAAG